MKRFADLYAQLDATTKTNAKIEAMAAYFRSAPKADAAWAVFFLTGQRLKRFMGSRQLRAWAMEETGLPVWLVDDSYSAVGDTAETVALLLDSLGSQEPEPTRLAVWMEERILPLRGADEWRQAQAVKSWWRQLDRPQRFLLNKLLTGGFRVGVSQGLVVKALARASELDEGTISHRLMGHWEPSEAAFQALLAEEDGGADLSRPYPFFLASPLETEPETLGAVQDWLVEWKWDGIRGQLVKRGGTSFLWSRGEELITERFPEITEAAARLPDGTVLDGEILAWDGEVLPFSSLQKRIGRIKLTPKVLAEAPARFLAYDLLEQDGTDQRGRPQGERRTQLETLVAGLPGSGIGLSPLVETASWAELAEQRASSRGRRVEGLMLKRKTATYQVGRRRGDWWKWKIDPLTVDMVLIYAQAGSGRRANLFTDYTFAVWDEERLVPVAKAYSGLDDREIAELDKWIRRNTIERFGPVRSVPPIHVFEIAFEGINVSSRHKSGIAVRFPRIARWRKDLKPAEADSLAHIKGFLEG